MRFEKLITIIIVLAPISYVQFELLFNAVVPLPDFLKIGSSTEIQEVGIEIIIQK